MKRFDRLAIPNPAELLFGVAPKPVLTRRGMSIGGGQVYPELNFTLPPMFVDSTTMPEVRRQYHQIIAGALQRATELEAPGLVVEFETLPPMTENPSWGIELTRILLDGMAEAHAKHGLKSVLRITPNDTREMERPARMRSGPLYEAMLATFEGCAAAGAELLSIESVGGKEVHDEALMMGDIDAVIFGLCILGVRDIRFLWTELNRIACKHGVRCAGDTACAFANTAMVLAEQIMNEALADGRDAALLFRKWMVASDARRDPQAFILSPENAIAIAQSIVSAPSAYDAGNAAALTALRLIREGHRDGALKIPPREVPWLDRLQKAIEAQPAGETEFITEMMGRVDTSKFIPAEYGIG